MHHQPPRHLHRRWWQKLLVLFNVIVILTCGVIGYGLYYARNTVNRVQKIALSAGVLTETSKPSAVDAAAAPVQPAENFLLVGVDDSSGLASNDVVQLGRSSSENTDTIMIMRIDPATQRAAILSIPRDFSAKFALGAGHHFTGKINGAAYYGDDVLINTIKDALGIPINHYVKVDFKGFERLVNTIGGVPMYFPTPARDVHSQLYVPSAGCITLSGAQALAYARSRYYQYQGSNGGWIADNTYDYGRIHRQQDFIRRTLKQAIAKGARNPATMLKMINDVLPALTFDQTFNTADKVYSFAQQLKNLEPDHITTYTIETKHKDGTEDNLEYVDTANNRSVLQYFTNGQVLVAPGSGTDPAVAGGGPSVPTTTRVFGPDPATASSQSTDSPTAATTCGQ